MALPDTDAIVLESNGHFGIVDSGEDDDYADGSDARYPWRDGIATWGYTSNVDAYLQKLGVNSSNLDFYIGTHSHSDHIGNADTIIYKYRSAFTRHNIPTVILRTSRACGITRKSTTT